MSSSSPAFNKQGSFPHAESSEPAAPAPGTVQPADTPVSGSDTPVQLAQVGVVGATFLRVRPWVVVGPAAATMAALATSGAPLTRVMLVAVVQVSMLAFFITEAVGLARAGRVAYVSPRRLGWSLVITVTGLGIASGLTGASRSPLLPMLLAPVGIAFAAFGARPVGLRVLVYLAGWLVVLAGWGAVDAWPAIPRPAADFIALSAVALAAVLLWFGVAALTTAHAATAADLDHLRRRALEEASSRLNDLEAVGAKVAHELKNPLAAVKALTQLNARQRPEDPHDPVILRELDRMAATLDAYLSFARPLDDLRWQRVAPRSLATHVAQALAGRAHQQGVELDVRADDGEALLDPARLTDALSNLLSNALDASPRGAAIRLTVALEPGRVRFEVEDRGPGMDAATLGRLGTPYFTTRDGGTGLGVVLARTVARQHGGDLTYDTEPGRGTTARLSVLRYPGGGAGGEEDRWPAS